jgi:hypothetical protein
MNTLNLNQMLTTKRVKKQTRRNVMNMNVASLLNGLGNFGGMNTGGNSAGFSLTIKQGGDQQLNLSSLSSNNGQTGAQKLASGIRDIEKNNPNMSNRLRDQFNDLARGLENGSSNQGLGGMGGGNSGYGLGAGSQSQNPIMQAIGQFLDQLMGKGGGDDQAMKDLEKLLNGGDQANNLSNEGGGEYGGQDNMSPEDNKAMDQLSHLLQDTFGNQGASGSNNGFGLGMEGSPQNEQLGDIANHVGNAQKMLGEGNIAGATNELRNASQDINDLQKQSSNSSNNSNSPDLGQLLKDQLGMNASKFSLTVTKN